jgi:hypothetical protein
MLQCLLRRQVIVGVKYASVHRTVLLVLHLIKVVVLAFHKGGERIIHKLIQRRRPGIACLHRLSMCLLQNVRMIEEICLLGRMKRYGLLDKLVQIAVCDNVICHFAIHQRIQKPDLAASMPNGLSEQQYGLICARSVILLGCVVDFSKRLLWVQEEQCVDRPGDKHSQVRLGE